VTATLISVFMSEHTAAGANFGATAVITIAAVKARFVGLDFMELRGAPVLMRVAFEAWVVTLCVALVCLYLV
jgi:hypothetical protein